LSLKRKIPNTRNLWPPELSKRNVKSEGGGARDGRKNNKTTFTRKSNFSKWEGGALKKKKRPLFLNSGLEIRGKEL